MTRTKRGEHPHRSEESFRKPTFFSDRVDLATVPDGPSASVQAIHSNAVSSEVARNSYAVHWKGNPQPWRWMCRDGSPAVDDAAMIERDNQAHNKLHLNTRSERRDAHCTSTGTRPAPPVESWTKNVMPHAQG